MAPYRLLRTFFSTVVKYRRTPVIFQPNFFSEESQFLVGTLNMRGRPGQTALGLEAAYFRTDTYPETL